MDISAVVISIGLVGAAIGGSASYAIVKFGVKNDIKALKDVIDKFSQSVKDRDLAVDERIRTIEKQREDTKEYIIRTQVREENREGRESKLIDSLVMSTGSLDKMVSTMQEFVKVDLTGIKNDIRLIKDEISWFTEERSRNHHHKK